jgi:hypothetical protein
MVTCDPNDGVCNVPHTTEPAPYNHTCDGGTCDGHFTCDFTVDPRAETCDAADPLCQATHGPITFNHYQPTCDPMNPGCRLNNPKHCTAQEPGAYLTCDPSVTTCDATAGCETVDPVPPCATPTKWTTWGQLKDLYEPK